MENVTVRSFRVSAPTVWDNLLEHLRNYHMQKIVSSRKTFLFSRSWERLFKDD